MSGSSTKVDWGKVRQGVKRALPEVLMRQGAYVRGVAARSIRRVADRLRSSAAGSPPYTHSGALKGAIEFSVQDNTVLIGPRASWIGTIGALHEFGGVVQGREESEGLVNWRLVVGGHGPIAIRNGVVVYAKYRSDKQVQRALALINTQSRINVVQPLWSLPDSAPATLSLWRIQRARHTARYPARPYMGPALAIAQERLPGLWANSVTG